MKIAIMQPYVFPYLPYFQHIASVDLFYFLDNVNFIKKGWINRNQLIINNSQKFFTIPCIDISQNRKINETKIDYSSREINKLLKTIKMNYSNAPYFSNIYELIASIFETRVSSISELAELSTRRFCEVLSLKTEFKTTSSIPSVSEKFASEERLINIALFENAKIYVNPIGGIELYKKENFALNGIDLKFLKTELVENNGGQNNYVSFNSIIDIAMHNSIDRIKEYLEMYRLV